MRMGKRSRALLLAALTFGSATPVLTAQISTAGTQAPAVPHDGSDTTDPLAVGKAAMQRKDYAGAREFFGRYVSENPNSLEAKMFLGGADLALGHPKDAIVDFQDCLKQDPNAWTAHESLILAYAQAEEWADFDRERALLQAARKSNATGLSMEGHDVIDILRVNGETYQAWFFPKLHGQFNTRYVFLHFDAQGKADHFIQCESDDADQGFFVKAHPKEAAAGERSFSLDSYTVGEKGMTQALIKFYPDGEPAYETVRTDALKVLSGQSKPAATTTAPATP